MVLGASVLVPSGASADTIFLSHDFDSRTPGIQSYFEQHLSLTTSFGDGGHINPVEIVASANAVSPPNLVKPAIEGGGLFGRFLLNDWTQFTLATDILFFTVTGPQQEDHPYSISLFDRNGALLDSTTGWISQGFGFTRRTPDIHAFTFQPGLPGQGLDDLRYTPPVVPEPTTVLLTGTGLAAAWWRRRRRAAAQAA
jgi:hypothetical protein